MSTLPAPQKFSTASGIDIYRIPVTVFPNGFVGFVHLLVGMSVPTLIDTGSGIGSSNDDLIAGLNALPELFGTPLRVGDIGRIIVTHGHIDHFGGVAFMMEQSGGAQVGIHELDRRVLTNYEERVTVATKDLRVYLERAGLTREQRQHLINMYSFGKRHFSSVNVDFVVDEDHPLEAMEFIHAPGHCPGQVCIRIDDVLLSADHILSHTTPHQAPESITHYMGVGHYREALHRIAKQSGIRLALGGHEEPIHDLYGRIETIMQSHERKLNRVLDIVRNAEFPLTISEITARMYPERHGYDELLALEEAGAHIEYLYDHGTLSVANLEEVEKEDNPPLRYVVS